MSANDHAFEGYIESIKVGDKATKITFVLAPESDDAYTLTSLIDFKRRGKVEMTAKTLQPAFDDLGGDWKLPDGGQA